MFSISFRKVSSPEGFRKLINFLRADVQANGGSASEIIDLHGHLQLIMVCQVPWGKIVVNQPMSRLEALAWFLQDPE